LSTALTGVAALGQGQGVVERGDLTDGLSTALQQCGEQASPGVELLELRRGARSLLERQVVQALAVRVASGHGEIEQCFVELVPPPVEHQRVAQHIVTFVLPGGVGEQPKHGPPSAASSSPPAASSR
jgi:hypothetical protein